MKQQIISIQWMPKDALDGMQMLSAMEELAYRRIIDLIYISEDNLPDDDKQMAWSTKTGKQWKKVKTSLISHGKIQVEDGRIRNSKCTVTITKTRNYINQKQIAGNVSAVKRKSLENNKTRSTAVDDTLQRKDNEPPNVETTGVATSHKPIASKEEREISSSPLAGRDDFFKKCFDYIVARFPAVTPSNSGPIYLWQKAGYDFDTHIKPVVDSYLAKGKKPFGFGYFTPEIERTGESKITQAPTTEKPEEMTPERLESQKKWHQKMGIQHPVYNPEGLRQNP